MKVSEPGPGADDSDLILEPTSASRLLQLLVVLPHGALKKSHAIAGLVETRCSEEGTGWVIKVYSHKSVQLLKCPVITHPTHVR